MSEPGILRRAARARPEYALAVGVNLTVLATICLMFFWSVKMIFGWIVGSTVTLLLNLVIDRKRPR